jgi:hypothetical protein
MDWPSGTRRRAGVSSFGFSGTNAHVILEEAPAPIAPAEEAQVAERPLQLLALSAKSQPALQQLAEAYGLWLEGHPEVCLGDVCFTANTGRAHFESRLAVVGQSVQELGQQLREFGLKGASKGVLSRRLCRENRPQVAFLFSGQGTQQVGMGRELYQSEPVFRRALEGCAELLNGKLSAPLLEVLYGDEGGELLEQTLYTQTGLFSLEYALSQLWKSWGIEPVVVLGHSLGEYVAACVAGVMSLEDALKLVVARARLMQEVQAEGAMAAVLAKPEEVEKTLGKSGTEVSIAAINGPQQAVDAMVAEFRRRRDAFCDGLNQIPGVRCALPGGAFYAFANITQTGMDSKTAADFLLNEAGVERTRTPRPVQLACAAGYSRPVLESLIANLLCRGAAHITYKGHRGAIIHMGMAIMAHKAATVRRIQLGRLSTRAQKFRRLLRLKRHKPNEFTDSKN